MLIEHNNRSIEDKPNIDHIYNSFCPAKIRDIVALRRSTGCFNQQSLSRSANTSCVTPTALKDSSSQVNARQLKNNAEKSTHAVAENST